MPTYTDEDKAKLDAATALPIASTLVKRGVGAGTALNLLALESGAPAAAPSTGVRVSATEPLRAIEPNGVLDAFNFVDVATGATTKFHRTYVGRVASTTAAPSVAVTIPAPDLPSGDWSAHLVARVHAYDPQSHRLVKLTRNAGVRRTSGATSVPTQDQDATFDTREDGAAATATIQASAGDLIVSVQHLKVTGVLFTVWAELLLVEH